MRKFNLFINALCIVGIIFICYHLYLLRDNPTDFSYLTSKIVNSVSSLDESTHTQINIGFASLYTIITILSLLFLFRNTNKWDKKFMLNEDEIDKLDLNKKDTDGQVILMTACKLNHLKLVEVLINKGADVNAKDKIGGTPLIIAAMNNHIEIVELLITAGANVNAKTNKDGETVLMTAVYTGNKKLIELLTTAGANVNAKSSIGATSLMLAVLKKDTKIVKLLIEKGAEINVKTKDHPNILSIAKLIRFNGRVIRLLIAKGAEQEGDK